MDSKTLLDYALFQLTPTRTRLVLHPSPHTPFSPWLTVFWLVLLWKLIKDLIFFCFWFVGIEKDVILWCFLGVKMRNWHLGWWNLSFLTWNLLKIRFQKVGIQSLWGHLQLMPTGSPKPHSKGIIFIWSLKSFKLLVILSLFISTNMLIESCGTSGIAESFLQMILMVYGWLVMM